LDIGVLGYIGIVQHKEHSPEVWHIPPGTPCISLRPRDTSDSTASTVTTLSVQRLGNWDSVHRKARIFLFCTVSRRSLRPEQLAVQYKSRGGVFLWG